MDGQKQEVPRLETRLKWAADYERAARPGVFTSGTIVIAKRRAVNYFEALPLAACVTPIGELSRLKKTV